MSKFLKMMKFKMVALATVFFMPATIASASSIQALGQPKSVGSMISLGKAPEKKLIVLNLGPLRLGEAELPPGELTLAQRNRLRIRRAADLQDAVAMARRERLKNRNTPSRRPQPQEGEGYEDEPTNNYGDGVEEDPEGNVPAPGDVAIDEGGEPIEVAEGGDDLPPAPSFE